MAIPNNPTCSSTHYAIFIDSNLNNVLNDTAITNLCQLAEADFAIMQSWFQGTQIPAFSFPVAVQITASDIGTGAHTTWAPNSQIRIDMRVPNQSGEIGTIRINLVEEIVEVFMFYQRMGWYGGKFRSDGTEGTVGEGLSIFLGQQLAFQQRIQSEFLNNFHANQWMKSNRPTENLTCLQSPPPPFTCPTLDYVNSAAPGPDPNTGGGITNLSYIDAGYYLLFLYYLKDVRGFSINQIIAAGPVNTGSITEVYQRLTGDRTSDPNQTVLQLINSNFPNSTTLPFGVFSPFTTTQCPPDGWRQENGNWVNYKNCVKQTGWVFNNEPRNMLDDLRIGTFGQTNNWYLMDDNTGAWTKLVWNQERWYRYDGGGNWSLWNGSQWVPTQTPPGIG